MPAALLQRDGSSLLPAPRTQLVPALPGLLGPLWGWGSAQLWGAPTLARAPGHGDVASAPCPRVGASEGRGRARLPDKPLNQAMGRAAQRGAEPGPQLRAPSPLQPPVGPQSSQLPGLSPGRARAQVAAGTPNVQHSSVWGAARPLVARGGIACPVFRSQAVPGLGRGLHTEASASVGVTPARWQMALQVL